MVFFTPEVLLLQKKWRNLLMTPTYSDCLRAIVVDEAHAVKKLFEMCFCAFENWRSKIFGAKFRVYVIFNCHCN